MFEEEFRVGECDIMEWVLPIEPIKTNTDDNKNQHTRGSSDKNTAST